MKKTNEEILQFYGLKVGDKIKVDGYYYPFVIVEENGKIFAKRKINYLYSWDYYDIGKLTNVLLKNEYEVVKPKKKLGDMKCGEMSCNECPFISFDCSNVLKSIPKATLYEVLEGFMTIYNFEKIREELDKDVEE